GIRDRNVTGVQTCALPISSLELFELQSLTISLARSTICFLLDARTSSIPSRMNLDEQGPTLSTLSTAAAIKAAVPISVDMGIRRSEERRVGKECRWRGPAG